MKKSTSVVLGLVVAAMLCVAPARGADLGKAKELLEIGDYAAAVLELDGILKAEPKHAEARLLMARAFAECAQKLQMPGLVVVGRTNRDRALYQLEILARLGEPGARLLCDAIENGGPKLAPLAMRAAGRRKLAAAVQSIAKTLKRADADLPSRRMAAATLAQIKGAKAAAVLKGLIEKPADPQEKPWLTSSYLACLDDKALLELARTTKDRTLIRQMSFSPTQDRTDVLLTLVKRRDIDDADRAQMLYPLSRTLPKQDPDGYAELLGELAQETGAVAAAAAVRLADVAPDKAVAPLVAALADKKTEREALRALQNMKNAAVVEPLLKVLEEQTDAAKCGNWAASRNDVYRVVLAAGRRREPLFKAVRLMLRPDPSRKGKPLPLSYRRSALYRIPKGDRAFVIGRLLEDTDAEIRRLAAGEFHNLEPDKALALARTALTDRDAQVRRAAGRAVLQQVSAGRAKRETLLLLLKSDDGYVLQRTVAELTKKPGEAPVDALLELLRDRKRAPLALRGLVRHFTAAPDEMAVEPLVAALRDEKLTVSASDVAAALKKCAADVPKVARKVAEGLKDKSLRVQANAVVALRVLGDPSVLPDLRLAWEKTTSSHLRRVIDNAIRRLRGE